MPLFEPETFNKLYDGGLLKDDFALAQGELQTYGEMATEIRRQLADQAL